MSKLQHNVITVNHVASLSKCDEVESIDTFLQEIDFTQGYASSLLKSARNAFGWKFERLKKEQKNERNSRLKWINQSRGCGKHKTGNYVIPK